MWPQLLGECHALITLKAEFLNQSLVRMMGLPWIAETNQDLFLELRKESVYPESTGLWGSEEDAWTELGSVRKEEGGNGYCVCK